MTAKLKLLYSDNGGEYVALQDNLDQQGIEWEYCAPYTPQQNGVAERLNRTLMETARTILQQSGLPDRFWGEAVSTAASLRNITGTRAHDGKTPVEVLSGVRPFVGNLRTFGCEVWMLVSKRKKLDPKARRGILLQSLPRRNYRVWDIEKGNICHVRHVRVNESVFPAKEWNATGSSRVCDALKEWCKPLPLEESGIQGHDGASDGEGEGAESSVQSTFVSETDTTVSEPSPLTYFPPSSVGIEQAETTTNAEDGHEIHAAGNTPDVDGDVEEGTPVNEVERRYPARHRNPVIRFEAGMMALEDYPAPKTLAEAYSMPDGTFWRQAVQLEVKTLAKHDVWFPETVPVGAKVLDSRFVFVLKRKADGLIDKYKARLVVKGFQEGYVQDVYAPVVDFSAIRVALACLAKGAIIHHLDVKSAFLNGALDEGEIVYVNPPRGLDLGLKPGEAMRLLKALYGWKRAPKIWSKTFREAVKGLGFTQLKSEECFYFVNVEDSTVWVIVYVDDVLVMGMCPTAVETVKDWLKATFEMTDHGVVTSFLGVEFVYTEDGLSLRQKHFINTVLHRFNMFYCKPVGSPMSTSGNGAGRSDVVFKTFDQNMYQQAIGALLYISTRTRPDISAAVGIMARK